jgi:uncharacterized membrane protein YjgN (DUF898 family)
MLDNYENNSIENPAQPKGYDNLDLDINDVNNNKQFKYHGQNGDFFIIYLKNMVLTFLSLGLYYPWAKVEILKYHYQNTQLEDSRFQFTGTGKEVFRGFIKVYALIVIIYALLIYAASSQNETLVGISLLAFYVIILCMIPLAIHGAMRYRSSRSVYSGIHFKYTGERMVFFKMFFKEFFFTIVSFGIYSAWMQVNIRKYIFENLHYGNVNFKFIGEGFDLFILNLKGIFLTYLTLGIYFFWYQKNLIKFMVDNTKLMQNTTESSLDIAMTGGELFKLIFVNLLIVMFTFGLGAPIATIRTMNFVFEKLKLNGPVDLNNVIQGNTDDYNDASGDDFLDFFDFDLL